MDYYKCLKQSVNKVYSGEVRGDVGIAFDERYIDISFDDEILSRKIYNYLIEQGYRFSEIYNPNNGHRHFIFKNNGKIEKSGSDLWLNVGVVADVHFPSPGKKQFTFLMKQGEKQPREFKSVSNESECPFFLLSAKWTEKPWLMGTGDGRNEFLYKTFRTQFLSDKINYDDFLDSAKILNDYIFIRPLGFQEFQTVTREDGYELTESVNWKVVDGKGNTKIDPYLLAQYIYKDNYGCNINGECYMWLDGEWTNNVGKLRLLARTRYEEGITAKNQFDTIYRLYQDMALMEEERLPLSWEWIGFENCVLNIMTGQTMEYSPNFYIECKIPHRYNPDAPRVHLIDQWLLNMANGSRELRDLFLEMIGYIFLRRNEKRTGFYIYSAPKCGKSTFINFLLGLIGQDNTTGTPLTEIDRQFGTAQIPNKLLLINDDIKVGSLNESVCEYIKKIISGDTLNIQRKYKEDILCKPIAKVFVTSNEPLAVAPTGHNNLKAVVSRFLTIPLQHVFENPDDEIIYKLCREECYEYVINKGIEAVKPIITGQRGFTIPELVKNSQINTLNFNKSYLDEWFTEVGESGIIGKTNSDLCQEYEKWLIEEQHVFLKKGITSKRMSLEIANYFPGFYLERVALPNGKQVRRWRTRRLGD